MQNLEDKLMTDSNKILPLGSIVYLKEGTKKLMVVGRGIVYTDEG